MVILKTEPSACMISIYSKPPMMGHNFFNSAYISKRSSFHRRSSIYDFFVQLDIDNNIDNEATDE
jgi:hypothetical protein